MPNTLHDEVDASYEPDRSNAGLAKGLIASGLPCALVTGSGVISEASAALQAMVPDLVGSSMVKTFQIDTSSPSDPDADTLAANAIYRSATGELLPAIVQTACRLDDTGASLVVVTDCAAIRRAEAKRFESTPFTVMRLSPDGVVRFANPEALKTFVLRSDAALGRPLTALIDPSCASALEEKLEQCLKEKQWQHLAVKTVKSDECPARDVSLIFTPDIAPGGRTFGALVLVNTSTNERVRDEIARIALDTNNKDWKKRLGRILAAIQQVIKFEHATFAVLRKNLTLFRGVAIYPEGSINWPARWLVLEPGFVENWIRSKEFWISDLADFGERNPSFKENEIFKAYLNAKIASSVTLIVDGPDGPTSALSLCSTNLTGTTYSITRYCASWTLHLSCSVAKSK